MILSVGFWGLPLLMAGGVVYVADALDGSDG